MCVLRLNEQGSPEYASFNLFYIQVSATILRKINKQKELSLPTPTSSLTDTEGSNIPPLVWGLWAFQNLVGWFWVGCRLFKAVIRLKDKICHKIQSVHSELGNTLLL